MSGSVRSKRTRRAPEEARRLILEAAGRVMLEEGYAAVTARRIAKEIGLTSALIHYYYPTVDDLFIALHGNFMDRHVEILELAANSPAPLRELWRAQTDSPLAAMGLEFIALANHRKNVAPLIAARAKASSDQQAKLLQARNIIRTDIPGIDNPKGVTLVLLALARLMVNQKTVGLDQGHENIEKFVDWLINTVTAEASGEIETLSA